MTQRRTRRLQMLFAVALILAAVITHIFSRNRGETVGRALRRLTGGHTRVVWIQDLDESTDLSAHGWELRLMGFDSDDGLGEHPIRNELSSCARPLITPKGDRILLSSRIDNQVYIVNWDGSGLRPLLWGFALDTWIDPADGVEWLYFGTGPRRVYETDKQKYSAVLRCPIDDPEKVELVWSKSVLTLRAENNFQVSGDGYHASLNRSGRCGVADLPNAGWTEYGSGSWPSMSASGGDAFWFLNDDQRSLSVFNGDPSSKRTVSVNSAPGVDGDKICQPRWANNARVLALAGPLKDPGEERALEIYVGRFDEDLTHVEDWVSVSRNRRANFAPDVWVEREVSRPAESPAARRGLTWPVNDKGAEFINEGFVTGVQDVKQLAPHCRKSNEFTLEAVVTPDSSSGSESGNIISFCASSFSAQPEASPYLRGNQALVGRAKPPAEPSAHATRAETHSVSFCNDAGDCNFSLGVQDGQFVLSLRTSDAPEGKTFAFTPITPGKRYRIVAAYSPGKLTVFVDAKRALISEELRGDLENWRDGRLVFGGSDWRGTVEGVGIYSRRHYGEEVTLNNYLYGLRLKYRYFAERARRQSDS